jgi:hypothetical protein
VWRSQWPSRIKRGSEAARQLRLWVRIPPEAWMFFLWLLCVVWWRPLRQEDRLSKEVPPLVVCLSVIVKPVTMWRSWPTSGYCVM